MIARATITERDAMHSGARDLAPGWSWSILPLVLWTTAGCTPGTPQEGAGSARAEAPAPSVEVVAARSGRLPLEERLSGLVRAANQVEVRAQLEATVVEVLVRSGQAVERDQPLVRLDDEQLKQQLRQAQATVQLEASAAAAARARVAELEAQVKRSRTLAERALVSPLEVEIQEAQLLGARAAVEQSLARVELARASADERRAALERAVVRAPVPGRLGRRRVEVGTLVTPGALLFELGDLERVIVEVPLTAEMLAYVAEGQPALISGAALGEAPLRARVARISPFLGAGSLSTTAEIDAENPAGRLYPGMFVTVDVLYGESEEATLVPTSALYEDPFTGSRGVYVVAWPDAPAADAAGGAIGGAPAPISTRSYSATLRDVEVLAEGRAMVGVRDLAPGEWVVVLGQHLLGRSGGAARVRATSWERVLDLQARHREELLRDFLREQQRVARTQGATPPSTDAFVGGGEPAPVASPAPARRPGARDG